MAADRKRASELARAGFDQWQAGKLQDAVASYEAAIALADPAHYATPDYHGEYAHVLAALGRDDDALDEFEIALSLEEADSENQGSAIAMARYFLGEHLLKMERPEDVMKCVAGGAPPNLVGPFKMLEALALAQLGDLPRAQAASSLAISEATSKQRGGIDTRLRHLLHPA